MAIQMKATEQYLPVVLFIMLYKVALSFESVNEILNGDHSIMQSLNSTFSCAVSSPVPGDSDH